MTIKQTTAASYAGFFSVPGFLTGLFWMSLGLMTPTLQADSQSIGQGSGLTAQTTLPSSQDGRIAVDDWQYSLRPDDNLQTLSQELLDSRHSLYDLLRHNQLNAADNLKAGNVLRIPVNWLRQAPEPARVISISGSAFHRTQHSPTLAPVTSATTLNVGDSLLTESGQVIIELADKSTLRVGPRSRVIFNRLTQFGRTGMADTRVRLERGEVETRVTPFVDKGSRFEIETPSAVAAVRGTAFRLQAVPAGTHLEVQEGRVLFSNGRQSIEVPAGQRINTKGQIIEAPQQLPLTPSFDIVPKTATALPVELRWQAADGASSYLLNVVSAKTGELINSFNTPQTGLSLNSLQNGTYRLELASLDAQGWQSIAKVAELTLSLTALPATPINPSNGFVTEEPLPIFQWQRQDQREMARVEIAQDADFKNLITTSKWAAKDDSLLSKALPAGQYFWRVVTLAGGTSQATSPARSITVHGVLPPVQVISTNQSQQQVRIFWQKNPAIAQYELQLSDDPAFNNILKTEKINTTTAALRMDQGKRYFVRLRGLVEEPLISHWGPEHEIILE